MIEYMIAELVEQYQMVEVRVERPVKAGYTAQVWMSSVVLGEALALDNERPAIANV